MRQTFSVEVVERALGAGVAAVELVETLQASANQVARLTVRFTDDRPALAAIGKSARGAGVAAARRELAFFEHVAPLWDSRAPALLGAHGDADSLVLLTEDLDAAGYALVGPAVSEPQLRGAIDALAALHARFWDAIPAAYLGDDGVATGDDTSITRCARAWPPAQIARNADAARTAAARFTDAGALTADERAMLDELLAAAPGQLAARAAHRRSLTLIHADYHVFGNLLFAPADPLPRIIDWSELKPGLGPHDVAYCLTGVPADDRRARDLALLRHYHDQLHARGVTDYAWALCHWDYRLSLIHNALQALFQNSLHWLRHSLATIELHDALDALRTPPLAHAPGIVYE